MTEVIDTQSGKRRVIKFATVAEMVAARFLQVGDQVQTSEYSTGNGGGNRYEIVAASTGTADGGSFIDLTGSGYQAKALWWYGIINIKAYGAVGDGATDDTEAIQAAFTFAKSNPGVMLFYSKGNYLITDSIDGTYAGSAAGLSSGYYGFAIVGEDKHNTYINARCAGKVALDFTGKPRMHISNFGIYNPTDDASNPSAAILLTRNTTNSTAGQHVLENVYFRGYYTETTVMSASSEVNAWRDCRIEQWTDDGSATAFELTEQLRSGVTSEYIDLSSHTMSGGNTRQSFTNCDITTIVDAGGPVMNIGDVDNLSFVDCYTKSKQGDALTFSANCSNVEFRNHRDESEGQYFIEIDSGVTLTNLLFTGRASREIHGADTSVITISEIDASFLATGGTYSLDVYDFTVSKINQTTNNIQIRNDASESEIGQYKTTSQVTVPSTDELAIEEQRISYTGGESNYKRISRDQNKYTRRDEGRLSVRSLFVKDPGRVDITAPTSETPDIDDRSCYSYLLSGTGNTFTVNNPTNVKPLSDDTDGLILILNFAQDSTGGVTVAFGSDFDLGGASVGTSGSQRTSFMFVYTQNESNRKWVRLQ